MDKENLVPIHSEDVLTKEQTEVVYEFAKIPIEDWELLGYTHDEAIELSELSVVGSPVITDQEFSKIVEALCSLPTVNAISAEELEKALERYHNESN